VELEHNKALFFLTLCGVALHPSQHRGLAFFCFVVIAPSVGSVPFATRVDLTYCHKTLSSYAVSVNIL